MVNLLRAIILHRANTVLHPTDNTGNSLRRDSTGNSSLSTERPHKDNTHPRVSTAFHLKGNTVVRPPASTEHPHLHIARTRSNNRVGILLLVNNLMALQQLRMAPHHSNMGLLQYSRHHQLRAISPIRWCKSTSPVPQTPFAPP